MKKIKKIKVYAHQLPSSCRLALEAIYTKDAPLSAGSQRGFETKSEAVTHANQMGYEITNLGVYSWMK